MKRQEWQKATASSSPGCQNVPSLKRKSVLALGRWNWVQISPLPRAHLTSLGGILPPSVPSERGDATLASASSAHTEQQESPGWGGPGAGPEGLRLLDPPYSRVASPPRQEGSGSFSEFPAELSTCVTIHADRGRLYEGRRMLL